MEVMKFNYKILVGYRVGKVDLRWIVEDFEDYFKESWVL